MSRYAQRLFRVARSFGCPVHGEPLSCPVCEAPESLPEVLETGMHTLIDAIIGRVGKEDLRAAALRVMPPPVHDACPRCGTRRQCGTCRASYGHRLLSAIGLTAAAEATMPAQLALARVMEQERIPQ